MKKTCTACGQTKAFDHFTRDRKTVDGRQSMCRACQQIKARKWRTQLGRERFTPETTA
jgi:hypothetical protein